jgi:hypothetical protein
VFVCVHWGQLGSRGVSNSGRMLWTLHALGSGIPHYFRSVPFARPVWRVRCRCGILTTKIRTCTRQAFATHASAFVV